MLYLNWNRLELWSNTTITISFIIKVEKYSLLTINIYKIIVDRIKNRWVKKLTIIFYLQIYLKNLNYYI